MIKIGLVIEDPGAALDEARADAAVAQISRGPVRAQGDTERIVYVFARNINIGVEWPEADHGRRRQSPDAFGVGKQELSENLHLLPEQIIFSTGERLFPILRKDRSVPIKQRRVEQPSGSERHIGAKSVPCGIDVTM